MLKLVTSSRITAQWEIVKLTVVRGVRGFRALSNIKDALRDLVPFVKFRKREKYPWRSVNFSTKINTPQWV